MKKELTDEDRALFDRYVRWVHPIANEFNAKYWPVMTMSKSEFELERARYIGTFYYVYQALRTDWSLTVPE